MKSKVFFPSLLGVMLFAFFQDRFLPQPNFFDVAPILMFLVIRRSGMVRTLIFTFLISVSLDFVLQSGRIKGLACMGQLPMIYLIMMVRRHIVPHHEDLFLLIFFAIFFFLNYYVYQGFCAIFGLAAPSQLAWVLLYRTAVHTLLFGAVLLLLIRFPGKPS